MESPTQLRMTIAIGLIETACPVPRQCETLNAFEVNIALSVAVFSLNLLAETSISNESKSDTVWDSAYLWRKISERGGLV